MQCALQANQRPQDYMLNSYHRQLKPTTHYALQEAINAKADYCI